MLSFPRGERGIRIGGEWCNGGEPTVHQHGSRQEPIEAGDVGSGWSNWRGSQHEPGRRVLGEAF